VESASGSGGGFLGSSRRPPPPVPSKAAKPAVLLGQESPRGIPAKPT
jgi:hypothetical protein